MDPKLKSILNMAMSVLPQEMGCDDCFEHLAAYADHILNGGPKPIAFEQVREHMERCDACLEELKCLMEAMKFSDQG